MPKTNVRAPKAKADPKIRRVRADARPGQAGPPGPPANDGAPPATTAQRLATILKSARDLMRKDKGLSGDVDRIPGLTWIMFLKFLDDMERLREEEATISGKRFKPAIEPPYRWRDWAEKDDGITGDELIAFVNQEECRRPDGSRGPGLFAYLKALRGAEGGDRRDVVATVFKGTINRMINGYLLRDVVNKVDEIQFTSSAEIHTLSTFYETMLREMRDAAGDAGEFYTPRPVVRFMVDVVDPRIGESVLDPACGTGGFLVEAYTHMEKECRTVQERRLLQQGSIFGNEAKPLPYLLAQMNLLLHGLETPRIEPGNSLAVALREIGDKDRVDVILTNPPFGGEEERGILSNFPDDKQTSETALLFLQLIMRKLRRAPRAGRAAIIVPNGVLYGDGVAARIRRELLQEFNLHTIVRLPEGVFEPYTPIPTNILFFDRSRGSAQIWFYEQPSPPGRRKYSKTAPISWNDFDDCRNWWNAREENERAWVVSAESLDATGHNLDLRNPRGVTPGQRRSAAELIDEVTRLERKALGALTPNILSSLVLALHLDLSTEEIGFTDLFELHENQVEVTPDGVFPQAGLRGFGQGLFAKEAVRGADTSYRAFNRLFAGALVISQVKGWEGAVAVCPAELEGRFVSPEYRTFRCLPGRAEPAYVARLVTTSWFHAILKKATHGAGGRRERTRPEKLALESFLMPSLEDQQRALQILHDAEALLSRETATSSILATALQTLLSGALTTDSTTGSEQT